MTHSCGGNSDKCVLKHCIEHFHGIINISACLIQFRAQNAEIHIQKPYLCFSDVIFSCLCNKIKIALPSL